MKRSMVQKVEKIANAVLYEGYMLYPYTASSLKNQKRWNFGVLSPPGHDTSEMRTECLIVAEDGCEVEVRVRFLWFGDGEEPEEREIDLPGWQAQKSVHLPQGGLAIVETAAERVEPNLFRLVVRVRNETAFAGFDGGEGLEGNDATRKSMLSTHTILALQGGAFVSLIDPPARYREAAAQCQNVGTWPVLVGAEGDCDTMLSSPIILYDYPRVAPESPGDLFDGAEIDEILTLRILTLSDDEKAEIRSGGARAREILERSELLPPEHIVKLHGALRGLRPSLAKVKQGDRVRLKPRPNADIFDIALAGKLATVEAVEQDFEGNVHLAVVLEDDPGRELGMMRQPGHRFFFHPEEVELVT